MPHDRQAAGTGGRHWPRGPLPCHTSGIFTCGKSTWHWKNSDLYYRGEAGSPAKAGNHMPGPTLPLSSLRRAKHPLPPRQRQPEAADLVQLNRPRPVAMLLVWCRNLPVSDVAPTTIPLTLAWTAVWPAARLARP